MHRSIFPLLTMALLLASSIKPTIVQAQPSTPIALSSTNPVSPFNLAYLAYQGYFQDQDIPSNGALINAIADGQITAQDLIHAAIKANRLPEQTLSDRAYRRDLEGQLQGLVSD